jgi:HAD superfamily hydrolase (TIGR01509 family)
VRKELETPQMTNQDFFELLRNSYKINPEVKSYIQEIRSKGIISSVCSNNFETRVRELNSKFDFLKDFDIRIFSFEVGAIKPDKKIFEVLLENTGVKPEGIIYSDDSNEKLKGALELGINSFVFENFEQFKGEVRRFGVL